MPLMGLAFEVFILPPGRNDLGAESLDCITRGFCISSIGGRVLNADVCD